MDAATFILSILHHLLPFQPQSVYPSYPMLLRDGVLRNLRLPIATRKIDVRENPKRTIQSTHGSNLSRALIFGLPHLVYESQPSRDVARRSWEYRRYLFMLRLPQDVHVSATPITPSLGNCRGYHLLHIPLVLTPAPRAQTRPSILDDYAGATKPSRQGSFSAQHSQP